MYGDRLAAADRPDTLARLALDPHLVWSDLEGIGKSLAHAGRMVTNLWPIRDNDHVDVVHGESVVSHNPTGSGKQINTRRVLPPWIVVRKMLSDVTRVCGAQNSIGDRMADSICVGMSQQSPVARDSHATEHERSTWDHTVKVIPQSNPETSRDRLGNGREPFRECDVAVGRDLHIVRIPCHQADTMPSLLDQRGLIRA